jgi:TonB family protein
MKRTMLAILALSPLMIHAQVKSPAQPQSTPILESSNTQPAAFTGIKADHAAAPTPLRVSTGVTPPTLVYSADVDTNHILKNVSGEARTVSVNMTVDASGKPTNVKVVQSTDAYTDGGIVAAVSQYRYKPATLDGTAIPIDVTVDFTIQ